MKGIFLLSIVVFSFNHCLFSQTKKDKARQLVSILYGHQLVENQLKNEKAILEEGFKEGAVKIKDTVAYFKWRNCELSYKKELYYNLYAHLKRQYTNVYDSLFTEGQLDRQLAFYNSETGKNFYKQFSGYVNPMQIFDFIFQDSSLSIQNHVEPSKQRKIDSLITLVMPSYLKKIMLPFGKVTGDKAKDKQNRELLRRSEFFFRYKV